MTARTRDPGDPPVAVLEDQLTAAIDAARDAYRDTSRLIRVLTVLGQPSSPAELVDRALVVLSQVYAVEITAVARVVDGRLRVTATCGLAEDDPAFTEGWPLTGGAAAAVQEARVVARAGADFDPAVDVPPSLTVLEPRSAVWVPVGSDPTVVDELLVVYRSNPAPFAPTELQVLGSVASRLRLAVESRERSAAVERLARSGHTLTRHLERGPLYEESVHLLTQLIDADGTGLITIEGGSGVLRAPSATLSERAGFWPAPVEDLFGWAQALRGETFGGSQVVDGKLATLLVVPVSRDGSPIALLYAFRRGHRPFRKDEADAASIFANYVAAALTNVGLFGALGESEASLRLITDSISDLIAVVDSMGRFTYVSPSHERELGYRAEELLGVVANDLVHPEDRARFAAAQADPAAIPKVESRVLTGSGTWVWMECALRPAPSAPDTLVLSSRIIDERRRLEEELRRKATHDPLTGLANRSLSVERLEEALAVTDRESPVGLLFCDLDTFKEVNDRLGHEAGDELLVHVAERLRSVMRKGDLLARFGGDEFTVILDGIEDLAAVADIGNRVNRALEVPILLRGERVTISASIGGVLGRRRQTPASSMLRDADAAMYAAKGKGRGRVEVFDDAASSRSLDLLELRSDLTRALGRGELSLHYQPIVELADGRITGFEALARWTHPQRGPIGPDVFIPLAEETGAIVAIGEWVLERACRQLAAWKRLPGGEAIRMSVNVSATQLQGDVANRILAIIRGAGVEPQDVWLEITEHSSIRSDVTEFVTELRRAGVHFALDDFGTSYSNLSHLKRLPVEIVKIDRSFVSGLTTKDTDRAIVRAVLAIADSLRLTAVAEGIETAEQRAELQALGCRQGQGFLFSRPVPADQATVLLGRPLAVQVALGR